MEDEIPGTIHDDGNNEDDDWDDNIKPDDNIGWPDEVQQSFYAQLGEKYHGLCAKHSVSDRCATQIWALIRSLFEDKDAVLMKGFKAVKQRNLSALPKLYVDTHYQDKDGIKHVMKNKMQYPRKFIETNKHTLLTVITHYRLPDIIRVIEMIHENMDKRSTKDITSDTDDEEDWKPSLGRRAMGLENNRRKESEPGEASFVPQEQDCDTQEQDCLPGIILQLSLALHKSVPILTTYILIWFPALSLALCCFVLNT